MKKIISMIPLLALLLSAADRSVTRMVELTIINKSGLPVELRLTGQDEANAYYLRVSVGDRMTPTEKTFFINPDIYQAVAYYIEPWDPVYGYDCSSKSDILKALKNLRVTIFECTRVISKPGEASMVKFGATRSRR